MVVGTYEFQLYQDMFAINFQVQESIHANGWESSRYGLLNFKCLMTIHATFDTQLDQVSVCSRLDCDGNCVSTVNAMVTVQALLLLLRIKVSSHSLFPCVFQHVL